MSILALLKCKQHCNNLQNNCMATVFRRGLGSGVQWPRTFQLHKAGWEDMGLRLMYAKLQTELMDGPKAQGIFPPQNSQCFLSASGNLKIL